MLAVLNLAPAWADPLAIGAARVWPAQDYTRITFESAQPIAHNLFTLDNPKRLVLDLDNVAADKTLEALADRIGGNDPYVKAVRIGRFKPGVVRLVFDLKADVKPQIFPLKPIGEYSHRLVLDIYPAQPFDPLLALLEKTQGGGSETGIALRSDVLRSDAGQTAKTDISTPPAATTPRPPGNSGTAPATDGPGTKRSDVPDNNVAAARSRDNARLVTVAIDAGHGGEDPGAKGRRGTHEKNVTLAIARKLKDRIDREPNMRGVLTRDGDYFIPLHLRVIKARRLHADLFVSVHADAFIMPHARGSSVFALSESGATSAAARWLAKHENEADLIGGVNLDVADPYLRQTLLDLSQTATITDSLKLGRAVLQELGGINLLHKAHVEQAGFAVLKAPDIPSILVETAFISNPDEERRLKDDAYQEKLADAIVTGIRHYFAKNPPLARSRLAQNP